MNNFGSIIIFRDLSQCKEEYTNIVWLCKGSKVKIKCYGLMSRYNSRPFLAMAHKPSFNAALSQSVGGVHSIMSGFRLGNISSLRLWLSFLQSNLSEPGIASDLVRSWHVIFNDERDSRNEEKVLVIMKRSREDTRGMHVWRVFRGFFFQLTLNTASLFWSVERLILYGYLCMEAHLNICSLSASSHTYRLVI